MNVNSPMHVATVSNECNQPVEQAHQSVNNKSDIQNEFNIPSSTECHDQFQPEHQKQIIMISYNLQHN